MGVHSGADWARTTALAMTPIAATKSPVNRAATCIASSLATKRASHIAAVPSSMKIRRRPGGTLPSVPSRRSARRFSRVPIAREPALRSSCARAPLRMPRSDTLVGMSQTRAMRGRPQGLNLAVARTTSRRSKMAHLMSGCRIAPLVVAVLVAIANVAVTVGDLQAQRPATGATGVSWTHSNTDWGDPDLEGVWTSDNNFSIPLERPPEVAEKEFLDGPELEAALAKRAQDSIAAIARWRCGGRRAVRTGTRT